MIRHKLNQKQRDIDAERQEAKDKKLFTKKKLAEIEARLKALEEKVNG